VLLAIGLVELEAAEEVVRGRDFRRAAAGPAGFGADVQAADHPLGVRESRELDIGEGYAKAGECLQSAADRGRIRGGTQADHPTGHVGQDLVEGGRLLDGLPLQVRCIRLRALLDHVGQFVSQQLVALDGAGAVPTFGEHDVPTRGVCLGADGFGGGVGLDAGMDFHVAQVRAQMLFQRTTTRASSGWPPARNVSCTSGGKGLEGERGGTRCILRCAP